MDTMNVPTMSISEVKKSPSKAFSLARDANNGVYVFNHGTVSGVMLASEQYEGLLERLERYEEELLLIEVERRLRNKSVKTYTDEEVRGKTARTQRLNNEDDGWE